MDLNYGNLVNTLTCASKSERSLEQQNAESQLKNWETVPGYHYLLQDVYLNTDQPLQIRWLAIICFKNGVDKYWRVSRNHSIQKDEKRQIISRTMDLINEKNNQLMIQNAHSIAKIARFDFPSDWPNLFDDIITNLEKYVFVENNLIATHNTLLILNRIIKTIATVRIGRARHAMQAKAPIVVSILIKLYSKFFTIWTSNLDYTVMQICYLCLKNLRRIIPEGFDQPHKDHDVVEFLSNTIDHLQGLVSGRDKYNTDLLERYVKCYSKLYVALIKTNPTSFVLLPCCEKILTTFLSLLEEKAEVIYNSTEENDFWEILALRSFSILKKVMAYVYKKGAVTLKQRNDKLEVQTAISKLSTQFFTPDLVQNFCDLIITWYLRLKPSDLESWLLEPEEWSNEELSTSWEYQIRPCAENFFQDLIKYFPDFLAEFVLNKISNGLIEHASVDKILIRDSILCTFQLSGHAISDHVNFDNLLESVFIPEGLKNDQVECKILKRRVCLIITEWVSIQCSRESRISIYKLLLNFLRPENQINDKIVKISAIQALRAVVDDWDFSKTDFQPFLNDFVKLMLALLKEFDLTESKLYILNTLAGILEKCNPLVDYQTLLDILQIIPPNWETSDKEQIIKASLLRVLKSLIVSLNENSKETHPIAIPLIRACCSESSDIYLLVSEDGYDLWLSLLQFSPVTSEPNPEIVQLFELIPYALKNSTEILPTILSIIRSYALYSPVIFSESFTSEIFQVIGEYLDKMRDDSYTIFISLMDILLINATDELVDKIVSSGLFNAMVTYVMNDSMNSILIAKMYLLFSRLANKEYFFKLLEITSTDSTNFFKRWLEYYGHNGSPRNKKINLLGLLLILSYGIPQKIEIIWELSPTIFKNTLFFLEEVHEDTNGSCDSYNSNLSYEDIDDYSYLDPDIKANGEKLRYHALLNQHDQVFSVNLSQLLRNCLLGLRERLSPDEFNSLIQLNNSYTIEKLNELLQ
ncbi:hypothetical protein SBY92_004719 [Candida maltosa Xu316]